MCIWEKCLFILDVIWVYVYLSMVYLCARYDIFMHVCALCASVPLMCIYMWEFVHPYIESRVECSVSSSIYLSYSLKTVSFLISQLIYFLHPYQSFPSLFSSPGPPHYFPLPSTPCFCSGNSRLAMDSYKTWHMELQ